MDKDRKDMLMMSARGDRDSLEGDYKDNHDNINPSYYSREATKVVAEMPYFLGAAVKYITRAGKKDPTKYREDLEKAKRCIEIHLE